MIIFNLLYLNPLRSSSNGNIEKTFWLSFTLMKMLYFDDKPE